MELKVGHKLLQSWHALEFGGDDWMEIECLDVLEMSRGADVIDFVHGQPFRGSEWLDIASEALAKASSIMSGFYDSGSEEDDDGYDKKAWAAQLRRIADAIHSHFRRQRDH